MEISKEQFEDHLEEDKRAFSAIHKKLDLLATKEDMKQIVEAFNAIKNAGSVLTIGGKWGFRVLMTLSAIILAWGVIMGGFKAILAGIFGWAVTPK